MDFHDDPLRWLRQASDQGPVVTLPALLRFTRASAPTGAVAVFGADVVRSVLSDIETFGMPVSISTRYDFPPALANLNKALFSLTGTSHRSRQRTLSRALGPAGFDLHAAAVDRGLQAYLDSVGDGRDTFDANVFDSMRRLARFVAAQVMFGSAADGEAVGSVAQRYFDLRRNYGSLTASQLPEDRARLIDVGMQLDSLLRTLVRTRRDGPHIDDNGVLSQLCRTDSGFDEDDLVAHANILFMAGSEPIATAMTWMVLALTQNHVLCTAIRAEATAGRSPLLVGLVHEVLRLVPPSAILVRLTRARTELEGVELAPQTEVMISPFVEHRSANVFRDPDRLSPRRWTHVRPGPFEFLPFGGGVRACLGKRIALHTLEQATAALVARFDPQLVRSQTLDWTMSTTLRPASDPLVRFAPAGLLHRGGLLSGPAAELLGVG